MLITEITAENFEQEVLNSKGTVLIDFWAGWCGPCKMQAPILEEFAKEHDEIKVGKVNVDEQNNLAVKFNIMTIPTLMVFKEGVKTAAMSKVMNKTELLELTQK